ncbi:MAG TPA: DinB family protein [Candidatus Acidoferrum sp.]|nr:DinB family protein [Candidatus Acidoferrum sp.]
MTSRELFIERRRAEFPVFLDVFKALPADKLSYKPHERCPSAEQLVWTLTSEMEACVSAAKERKAEWKSRPAPPLGEMLEMYDRWSNELMDLIAGMDDRAWDETAKFYYNGQVVSEQPIGQFLWMILFDAVHHRGQLTAYLRPMGGKVPAIYGPSADTQTA